MLLRAGPELKENNKNNNNNNNIQHSGSAHQGGRSSPALIRVAEELRVLFRSPLGSFEAARSASGDAPLHGKKRNIYFTCFHC